MLCPNCEEDVDPEELVDEDGDPKNCNSCGWENYDSGEWDFDLDNEDKEC